ncbi:MAG: hypothetical protein ACREIF_05295 [Chthoniobacterales bacterium]
MPMFPLQTDSFPSDAAALARELEKGLSRLVHPPSGVRVTVEDRNYPELSAIHVSLDGASVGDRLPARPAPHRGQVEPALSVENFEITGRPLRVRDAAINLSCRAREVEIDRARDAEGKVLLLLKNAAEGNIEISIPTTDLEMVVRAAAAAAAKEQGGIIEDVRIQLHARSARALDAVLRVRARKLFLNAAIRIHASLEIDDQLNARLSGLDCAGEGTLGTLVCGFLEPHLQQLNNRVFSLLVLPLGEVKLRDVQITVGTDLGVRAKLGGSHS